MCDEYPGSVPEVADEAGLEQVSSDVRVHGGQRVVQQVDVRALVHCARERDAGALAYTMRKIFDKE